MRRRDILRMWAQIVQHTGRATYTPEEWQESYEDFWKCMQSATDPYIRIDNIDHLINYTAPMDRQTQFTKRKFECSSNNYDESEPHAVLRKRIKLATNDILLLHKTNELKSENEKNRKGNIITKDEIDVHTPNANTIIMEQSMTSPNLKSSKLTDKKTKNRVSAYDKDNLPKDKAIDSAKYSIKRLVKNKRTSSAGDVSQENRNLPKEKQTVMQKNLQIKNHKAGHDQLDSELQINQLETQEESQLEQQCDVEKEADKHKVQKKNQVKKTKKKAQKEQDELTIEMEQDNKKQMAQQKLLDKLEEEIWIQKAEQGKLKKEKAKQNNRKQKVIEECKETEQQEIVKHKLQQREQEEDILFLKTVKQKAKQQQLNERGPQPNTKKTRSQLKKLLEEPEPSVPRCSNKAATQVDSIDSSCVTEPILEKQLVKETQHKIRTRSQCADKEPQSENQEQHQLNTKIRHTRPSRQSKAMAHMPQKAIDMPRTSLPDCAGVPDAVTNKDLQSIEPENLSITKLKLSEDIETPKIDHSLRAEPFEFDKPYVTYSKANCELEDKFINEVMQLAAPIGESTELSQLLVDDSKGEALSSGVEEIDRCLQIFNNKTPSEIDHQIADTSDFFDNLPNVSTLVDKTPLEMEALMNNVLNYDDDDDGDIISVATSWDGDEQFQTENTLVEETKSLDQPVQIRQSDAELESTIRPSELLPYRIPKMPISPADKQQIQQETQIQAEAPANLRSPQTVKNHQQPKPQQLQQTPAQHLNHAAPQQHQQTAVEHVKPQQVQQTPVQLLKHSAPELQPIPAQHLKNPVPQHHLGQPPLHQLSQPPRPQLQRPPLQQRQQPPRQHIQPLPLQHPVLRPAPLAKTLPIFAPPFRLAEKPASSAQSVTPNIYTNECKYFIFGIKCWRYLDGRCQDSNCNHRLANPWEVQRHLNQMKTDKLCDTYSMVLRHGMLFRNYFMIFAEIFGNRGMMSHLMKMVEDCGLYMEYSAPFITEIYYLLLRYELMPKMAAAHFMKHLWRPNIGQAYPDLTIQLLRILSAADWFNYIPCLKHLFYNQGFPIPVEFMTCLANDAVAKNDQVLVTKVWELVLFSPIDRNDDTLSSVIKILKNWCGSAVDAPTAEQQQKPQLQEQLQQHPHQRLGQHLQPQRQLQHLAELKQQHLPQRYVNLPQANKVNYNSTNQSRHMFDF
ncbi:trichohyalin isoform X2 [Drosophila hydei]|uniref:Trichohyalin isoform X2 n=1 Tax=Drosophila hydei TaxID=7224 RepID=A0A6J1MSF3_DROHY|nr:trichohyalin isoform X2 [Drosophila hydei]